MNTSKYLRVPYVLGGRSWEGADCYGLLCLVYREEFGIELGTYDDYEDEAGARALAKEHWYDQWKTIERAELKDGDVISFWEGSAEFSVHVGVAVNKGREILSTYGEIGVRLLPTNASHAAQFMQGRLSEYLRYVAR